MTDTDGVRRSCDGRDGDLVARAVGVGELFTVVPAHPWARAQATVCGPEARCSRVEAAGSPWMSATII